MASSLLQLPYTVVSGSVVCFLVFVACATVLGVIMFRVVMRTALAKSHDDEMVENAVLITSVTAAGINLFLILIMNSLYTRAAYYLTELEMPRTQTDFDNSLTLKMYILQFVNYYSSIFYVAFIKVTASCHLPLPLITANSFQGRFVSHPGDFVDNGSLASRTQEECDTGGCLVELAIQLAIIMVGKQTLNAIMEMWQPWFEWLRRKWVHRSKVDISNKISIPQWEHNFMLADWDQQVSNYSFDLQPWLADWVRV